MAAVPPPRSRLGGIMNAPAPAAAEGRAIGDMVATAVDNLEEYPMVAELVSKGMLKLEDVRDPVFTAQMEATLQKKAALKQMQGRDPRYSSTRAAFHAPVNVTPTQTPGVYRYQLPRFMRPTVEPSQSSQPSAA